MSLYLVHESIPRGDLPAEQTYCYKNEKKNTSHSLRATGAAGNVAPGQGSLRWNLRILRILRKTWFSSTY